jgi:acyl carrier protein
MLRSRSSDEKSLVAYVEPEKQPAPTSKTLRKSLAATLPDHMIPSQFVMLDTIPLTPTQKVDRKALPEPGNARPEMDTPFIAPRTSLERDIAKIWGDILSLDQVGVHDTFFDLGGHSLAAFRVISQVTQTFRVNLSPKALFDSPTVAEMAMVIETNLSKLAR